MSVNPTVPSTPIVYGPPAFVFSAVDALTVKHSSVVSVWLLGEYGAKLSGVYSARKQYRPTASGVNGPETAWPAAIVTALGGTAVPPDVQSGFATAGPQTKKLTVPVTGPFEPERVAVSVTD